MKFFELLDQATAIIPGYRQIIFRTLMIALATGGQPGRISNIFRKFADFVSGKSTLKRFYNFINSRKIPWDALWQFIIQKLGNPTISGWLLIALDDTTYGNTGKHIFGRAKHFDHAAKTNSSKYISGHCRVVAGILQFIHGRWACLPLAQKLFIPLDKKGKSSAKLSHEEWLKTKSGIAATLVIKLGKIFKHPILVVCDSWFGTYRFLQEIRKYLPQKVEFLTRLRISNTLFDFPEDTPPKRGRKRKYGKRLDNIPEIAAQLKNQAKRAMILVYGKKKEVCFSELICISGALKCEVKVVFVYYRNFTFPLITTNLKLTPEQMIEYYSARWKIESGFKEIKHEIGALDSQCRNEMSVENHFNLCLFATTFTWLYCAKLKQAPSRLHPTKHSNSFAFADIRRTIANEIKTELNYSRRCPEFINSAVKFIAESIFARAS